MSFCKFCKDLTTGKDNQTHDIVRVLIAATGCSLVAVMILGSMTYIWGYIYGTIHPELNIKPFDIQTFFNANSTIAVAISAFLMGGASALYMKKTTEPDGSQIETTSIKSGPGASEPTIEKTVTTNISMPG